MTCIVAIRFAGGVLMAADSAGVSGYALQTRIDPKIYRVGGMLIGFTSSYRMGQLLAYSLAMPEHHPDVAIERYMATLFVDAVRTCLKAGGFARKEMEVETAGTFLAVYRGRIFSVDSDYQIGERLDDWDAVGCGADIALGSLWSTNGLVDDPKQRARIALQAAEAYSAGVRGPFVLVEHAEPA